MKRYIFLVAAVALATVSCSKTYDTTTAPGRAIGFGTWTENLTRAITDPRTAGTNAFGVGDSFAVFGYKSAFDDSGKSTVFDSGTKTVEVEMTTAGTPGTWTYSPLRYWDVNYDKYTFFAVSPSSVGKAATVDPQTGEITSASIVFAGNNNDILVAVELHGTADAGISPLQHDLSRQRGIHAAAHCDQGTAHFPSSSIASMHFLESRISSSLMRISSPPVPRTVRYTSTSVVACMLWQTQSLESA